MQRTLWWTKYRMFMCFLLRSSVLAVTNIPLKGFVCKRKFWSFRPSSAVSFAFIAGLNFLQRVRTSPEGYAHFTLSGDYYNRALSGQFKHILLWDLTQIFAWAYFYINFTWGEWEWARQGKIKNKCLHKHKRSRFFLFLIQLSYLKRCVIS